MKSYRHSLQNHINKFSWVSQSFSLSSDLKNNKSSGSEETGRKADFLRSGNTVDWGGWVRLSLHLGGLQSCPTSVDCLLRPKSFFSRW